MNKIKAAIMAAFSYCGLYSKNVPSLSLKRLFKILLYIIEFTSSFPVVPNSR